MADHTDDIDFLKSLNLDILMLTRSEDARIRVFALECAYTLWHDHAQKLSGACVVLLFCLIIMSPSGFASETAAFILECSEDDNDDVVKEALKLKGAVEAGVGHIQGL